MDSFIECVVKGLSLRASAYMCLRKSKFDGIEIGILNFINALGYANKKDNYI